MAELRGWLIAVWVILMCIAYIHVWLDFLEYGDMQIFWVVLNGLSLLGLIFWIFAVR